MVYRGKKNHNKYSDGLVKRWKYNQPLHIPTRSKNHNNFMINELNTKKNKY